MSVITLPASASSTAQVSVFELVRSQEVLSTISGIAQVTSYPDRRWMARLTLKPQKGDALRAWSLALDQLSDLANVFALGPMQYTGPSTGYAGSNPLVVGDDQLGLSLDVDGLPNSTAILLAGDFVSFDTTSTGGSTNRQLMKVVSNVTSNGSGEATMTFTTPIRQAPANNATVNVLTPTAFFMLTEARSRIEMQLLRMARFEIDAVERIFP
jgi:hypothetical protein